MNRTRLTTLVVPLLAGLAAFTTARADNYNVKPEDVNKQEKNYSPGVGQNFPLRVYWGDTHLHTSYSTDAGMAGATLGPEDAYRFARGEEVRSHTGLRAKLRRPLDFLVVADHAEVLGLAPLHPGGQPAAPGQDAGRNEDAAPGTRLHLADLVYAGQVK